MGKVHGNNPTGQPGEGDPAEKLRPTSVSSIKSRKVDSPQEDGEQRDSESGSGDKVVTQTEGIESPVVNGTGEPAQDGVPVQDSIPEQDVAPAQDSVPVLDSVPVQDGDVPAQEESTEEAHGTDVQPQRHPTPDLSEQGMTRSGTPKVDSPMDGAPEQTSEETTEQENNKEKIITLVQEEETNEVNEQKESDGTFVKSQTPAQDSQDQTGEAKTEEPNDQTVKTETGDSNPRKSATPNIEKESHGSPSGNATNRSDRPTSVRRSRGASVVDRTEERRPSTGSSRKEKQASPSAAGSVQDAAGTDAKVIPKEPEGKEKELCDLVSGYIQQLKQMKSYDNQETLELVKAISQSYWKGTEHRQAISLVLCEDGFPALATHALKTLNSLGIFKNDSIWFPSYYFLNTVWNFSDCSLDFATDVSDVGMLDLLVANISHKPYLENLSSKNVTYIVKSSLSIMHNVARAPSTTPAFKDLRAEEALVPFAKGTLESEFLHALAVLTLSHIADDLSSLSDLGNGTSGVIDFIVDCMKKALKSGKRRFRGFMATELAEGLAKLAAQDSAKSKIISAGAIPVFTDMLKGPEPREQQAAAQAIWVLAFDDESRKYLAEETDIMADLEVLMKSEDENVRLSCLGALWILKRKLIERSETRRAIISRQTTLDLQKDAKERLIFVSYSWHDKKKVRKIAAKLKELGYNIWIDTEQMKENILQAMAQGIEDAAIFLMCMSETYKESPNARTEAEYAFKLKKPIIPLMMQKRYQPDGWLGIILGTKLYFNFSGKIPFDDIMDNFLKELNCIGKDDEIPKVVVQNGIIESTAAPLVKRQDTYRTIRSWTTADIYRWLDENELSSCKSNFKDFTGYHWCGLLKMKKEAPEYFYQSCEQKLGLNFLEILRITDALDYLIKSHDL